ncbi:hypothetical protein [Actinophytocola sediminis]
MFTALLGSGLTLAVQRINKRLDRKQEQKDAAEAEAARRPSFAIHRGENAIFYLVNKGDADATGIRLDLNGYPDGFLRYIPDGIDLPVNEEHKFMILKVWNAPQLSHFFVSCDQLNNPSKVYVPN